MHACRPTTPTVITIPLCTHMPPNDLVSLQRPMTLIVANRYCAAILLQMSVIIGNGDVVATVARNSNVPPSQPSRTMMLLQLSHRVVLCSYHRVATPHSVGYTVVTHDWAGLQPLEVIALNNTIVDNKY